MHLLQAVSLLGRTYDEFRGYYPEIKLNKIVDFNMNMASTNPFHSASLLERRKRWYFVAIADVSAENFAADASNVNGPEEIHELIVSLTTVCEYIQVLATIKHHISF